MAFIDFINDNIPNIYKDLYLKYLSTGYKAISLRLLEGIYNTKYSLLDVKINDEVYEQIFISTADGENLDKLGEELGFPRLGGESDSDYRNRLIAVYNIIQKGSTIESISEFIESLGYTIDYWQKVYDHNFLFDESGVDDYSYLGIGNPARVGWINYTIYFFLTPTPSQSDVDYLEGLIEDMKKYYNKVLIR
jgi:hypothetical protein